MTEFILGPSGCGKTTLIMQRILSDLKNGKHVILLVPEQSAVLVESRLSAEAQKQNVPQIRLEVLNFKRLCNRVFREYGGISYRSLTNGGKTLLLWESLFASAPYLRHYASEVEDAERFIPALLSAFEECKAYGVSPSDLESAARNCSEDYPKLASKLWDLSVLFAEYNRLIGGGDSDPSNDLTRLDEILARHSFFNGVSLYLDGFLGFTPQECHVLSRAMKQADRITVSFCIDTDGESMAFENAERELNGLIRLCGANRPMITKLTETYRFRSPELSYLEKNLGLLGLPFPTRKAPLLFG